MNDEQIKHMVNRFLGWRLPENFRPDCGIQFDADAAKKLNPRNGRYEPTGTNLFDVIQAETMVRNMIEGLPDAKIARLRKIEAAADALSAAMVDSEEHGADYDLVDEQWIALTAALQSTGDGDG